MPEQGAQEKTEKPTARRRGKAREQGQVAKSQEINSAWRCSWPGSWVRLWLMGGFMYDQLAGLMRHMFMISPGIHLDYPGFQDFSMFTIGATC
jgi:flagellar biosynthetic protein FlhB